MGVNRTAVRIGSDDYHRIVEFYYREATLLDDGDHESWLGLMTPDITYQMPTRQTVYPGDGRGFAEKFGFFDENHASLETRVRRLRTEQAWAEQPGSRTRHLVTNIWAEADEEGRFHVRSAFLVTRLRSDLPYDIFTGERRDVLRDIDGQLHLAERVILIDQTVLKSYNLSIFF